MIFYFSRKKIQCKFSLYKIKNYSICIMIQRLCRLGKADDNSYLCNSTQRVLEVCGLPVIIEDWNESP